MNEYWKDPRLDDEGTYDYLVEELPGDTAKWKLCYQRCDSCGKYHLLNFDSTHYFYCWDGWDSISHAECWVCVLKYKVYNIKYKITKKIKRRMKYQKLIKKFKEKNIPITKELKEVTKNLCQ